MPRANTIDVDVRRLDGFVRRGHRPGLDRLENNKTHRLAARTAPAGEARIQWFFLFVVGMIVAPGSVGLPDLNHCIRNRRLPIAVV